ncbi:S-adenosyl-L-methionine-dependent methyltransferase [Ascodesmis nigricans]|uniref:S-adenosyl-L-methionine-dependent methyltransferase n=1 Tax=Ascodesmis nigricans TaxID=341454 RepID=A0A4S2MU31_9PEZI|nr:S-adenosyl-L-methionine-dependent methyltransferase [Ascodesmis nigricans]
MGRNKTFRGKKSSGGGKREQNSTKIQQQHRNATQKGVRGSYESIPNENALYEKFYKESGFIPEEEWDDFWSALKRTLPTTFRFTGSKGHALGTMKVLKDTYVPHLRGIEWDGEQVAPPEPIPWYPDSLAWSMTVGKSTIRRCPPFKKFQNFLVAETTVGNISRQEAVSMIPPLMMDIEPHHTVLDMCAAPGSKTAQLIEMVHTGEEARVEAATKETREGEPTNDGDAGGRSTGLVIANDADYKRSHMLIHQTKRLNSPNLIVTNHDGTMFPSLVTSAPGVSPKEYLKFDRILADVPCSGDGTARKNYSVWRDWLPNSAFNLHLTQVRILVRGLQMLKVGGRLVYSTCSMNPVENEAVLAAAIDRCGGIDKVNLVDVSDRLPKLIRRPGFKSGWKIMDRDGVWYSNYNEVLNSPEEGREGRLARIMDSVFPTEGGKTDDDATRIPLERAMRVYPHLQDTGGFFIAVLEKKQEIGAVKDEQGGATRKKMAAVAKSKPSTTTSESATPAAEAEPSTAMEDITTATPEIPAPTEPAAPPSPGKRKLEDEESVDSTTTKKPKTSPEPTTEPVAAPTTPAKVKRGMTPEEPFKYLPVSHPVLQQIFTYYDLSPRFPRTCFMVRNADAHPARAIYFTSHLAKRILEANEGRGVKFVHCGVKAFMKQDTQSPETCPWRIQSEGLEIVSPWIGEKRVVRAVKRETVHALLRELFPKVGADETEEEQGKRKEEEAAAAAAAAVEAVETTSKQPEQKPEATTEQQPEANPPAETTPADTPAPTTTIDEIRDQVARLGMGCCVLKISPQPGEFTDAMVLPLWKSRFSCNLMLPKDDRKAMMLRLFDDQNEVRDSTMKNRAEWRDQQVKEKEGAVEATGETEGEVKEEGDVVMEEAAA